MGNTRFTIRGGNSLSGAVRVPGAKNAALKLIAATLLTDEPVTLENVPNITDVARMLKIIETLGADVELDWDNHRVTITAKDIDPGLLPVEDVRALRASIVLMGPLLARCGSVTMPYPGGDKIGARPLTAHIVALQQLGARIEKQDGQLVATAQKGQLVASRVVLPEFSVTATENALLAAALTPGDSTITIAAGEPHVRDLGELLTAMGAAVVLVAPNTFLVRGQESLRGTTHRIIGDALDAFTFLAAGLVTRGDVTVEGIDPKQLELPLLKLKEMGMTIETGENSMRAVPDSGTLKAAKIQALPYPGIPSDVQPIFSLLATQAEGASLVHDPLYENRFRYLEELRRMGADATMLDPHRAVITGPTPLVGIPITSFDIRAGAVLVLAGLVAQGVTTIEGIDHIDRGYENMEGRLRALGASIARE